MNNVPMQSRMLLGHRLVNMAGAIWNSPPNTHTPEKLRAADDLYKLGTEYIRSAAVLPRTCDTFYPMRKFC